MFGITTTRRHKAEIAALRSQYDALRERCETAEKNQAAERTAKRTAARQFAEADTANRRLAEELAATGIVNAGLTEDLTKARERIAQYGVRRTVSDVLEEHDVHRKALADALGDQKYHLNWGQLIAETTRMHAACTEWMAEVAGLKKRLSRAQADTVTLSGELAEAREKGRPTEGGTGRHRTASVELRQAREQVRLLGERVAELQQSHIADTRELHDLRQNGAAS